MNPKLWGSNLWIFLHLLTFDYNPEIKQEHKIFLNNLSNILPCEDCKKEYKKYMTIKKINAILKSKDDYIKGIWEFHNDVNKRLNKKQLTFNKFIEIYKEINNNRNLNGINLLKENRVLKLIILLLVIIIVMYLILKLFFKIELI